MKNGLWTEKTTKLKRNHGPEKDQIEHWRFGAYLSLDHSLEITKSESKNLLLIMITLKYFIFMAFLVVSRLILLGVQFYQHGFSMEFFIHMVCWIFMTKIWFQKGIQLLAGPFAPQPLIGPNLPNPAPAAWNCHLTSRWNQTTFAVHCSLTKVMFSNRTAFLWYEKWTTDRKRFYSPNWKESKETIATIR